MKRAYIKYIAGLLLFGSNGVVAGLISLSSHEIVWLRSFFGTLMLFGIFLAARQPFTAFRHKRDLLCIGLSGIAMAADWLLLFEAYARIGVSLGMLINYSGPAIVVALSPLIFHERITLRRLCALSAALAGVFLIGGVGLSGGTDFFGLLCAVLSAVSYAAMVICNKKSGQVAGMENALLQLAAACAAVSVFQGFKQGFAMDLAAGEWMPVLWLGLVNTGLGCWFYFSSIGNLPAQTVAVLGYLEPLSAVLLAAVFLHERMAPAQYLGAAFIICGAMTGGTPESGT